jgi:hypothetical protein
MEVVLVALGCEFVVIEKSRPVDENIESHTEKSACLYMLSYLHVRLFSQATSRHKTGQAAGKRVLTAIPCRSNV